MFKTKPARRGSRRVLTAFLGGCLALGAQVAGAQEPQGKTLILKVGYPPGGPADVAIRPLQAALKIALGQNVVVENLPGAGGSLAAQAVLRAPADGNTLAVLVGNDLITNPSVIASAKYKTSDFKLIHPLIAADIVLVTALESPPADIDAFVTQARAANREQSFGNWGTASMAQLVAGDFARQSGVRALDVSYKGVAPLVGDLLGRQIDYAFVPLAGPAKTMIDSGKLKALAIAAKTRDSNLPNVKTANEGRYLKNFEHMTWIGVFVPEGTPAPVVAKLNAVFSKLVMEDSYQKWSRDIGNRPMTHMNLQQAGEFFSTESERTGALVRMMKITPQ